MVPKTVKYARQVGIVVKKPKVLAQLNERLKKKFPSIIYVIRSP